VWILGSFVLERMILVFAADTALVLPIVALIAGSFLKKKVSRER
jgi:hypothetical protein